MTIHRRLNQAGQGGHYTTWWLLKTMLDAGWTVPFSGSGVGGLYDTSNVFDLAQSPKYTTILDPNGVGIGSEPWGHRSCWICLEDPSGNRQMVLQRSGSAGNFYDGHWYIYWSPGGRFGEGQVAGTDWDEDTVINAPDRGTEISNLAIFNNNAAASLAQIAADDTPSPEGEYGVFCVELENVNAVQGVIMLDDVRNAPVGHPHPITIFGDGSGALSANSLHGSLGADSPGTVIDLGQDVQRYTYNCRYCDYYGYSSRSLPGNGGIGVDGKERALPIVVVSSSVFNYMGVSRWLRTPSVYHSYPDTGGSQQYLYLNGVLVVDLLDGATTPGTI